MVASSYAIVFLGGLLCTKFEIQNSFREELNANALNLVKKPVWIFLFLSTVSTIYYVVFRDVFGKGKAPEGAIEQTK